MGNFRRRRDHRKGGRKIDTSAMREILLDDRYWIGIGKVVKDGTSHFEVDGADALIDVELMPSELPLRCRLASIAGGAGVGIWSVPAVGTEVDAEIIDFVS